MDFLTLGDHGHGDRQSFESARTDRLVRFMEWPEAFAEYSLQDRAQALRSLAASSQGATPELRALEPYWGKGSVELSVKAQTHSEGSKGFDAKPHDPAFPSRKRNSSLSAPHS